MDQTTIVSAACQICTIFLVFQGSRCLIPSFASTRDKNWENKSFEISNRKGEENKELKINERRSGQSRTSLLFCFLCQLHRSAEQNTRMAKGFSVTRDGWQTWCVIGHKLAAWGVIGHSYLLFSWVVPDWWISFETRRTDIKNRYSCHNFLFYLLFLPNWRTLKAID